jgi:diaminopimelate decarboxylase
LRADRDVTCEALALATGLKQRDPEPFETFIAGNLWFSADMLSRLKVAFPRKPVRGDVLLISSTGAYNPTFFASNANSRGPRGSCSRPMAIGPI